LKRKEEKFQEGGIKIMSLGDGELAQRDRI